MNYFFPSILTSLNFSKGKLPEGFLSVNSGKNAIRLLLRSYKLKVGSKIALPLYVCDSLKQSVLKEGLTPLYLDLKSDGTFWSDYNLELLQKERPAAVILVHLYGFLHPDTKAVMDFFKSSNIFLIHDAAQSYGIDENALTYSSGLVYSFGPGKSSTAAGGAIVKGLEKGFYESNCHPASNSSIQKFKINLFLKSRIYGFTYSLADKILQKLIYRFKTKDEISKMTDFQLSAASTVMQLVNEKIGERKTRYRALKTAIEGNSLLRVSFEDEKGLCFKMVLAITGDVLKFKDYLSKNNVPFFSLSEELLLEKEKHSGYAVFSKNAQCFVELSTEASLPMEEILRVADVLKKYV